MHKLRNGSKGGFESGISRLRVGHSTAGPPCSDSNFHDRPRDSVYRAADAPVTASDDKWAENRPRERTLTVTVVNCSPTFALALNSLCSFSNACVSCRLSPAFV